MTDRRLRIAFLSPVPFVGGAEHSLLELCRVLVAQAEVTIIVPATGPLATAARQVGASVSVCDWPPPLRALGETGGFAASALASVRALPSLWRACRDLRRLLATSRFDALVSNGIKAHIVAALAAPAGTPVVWYLREAVAHRALTRAAMRRLRSRASRCIAISQFVAGDAETAGVCARAPVVVYNAVSLARFAPGTSPAADLARDDGTLAFGMIGEITPLKGQDLFLRAAARVAEAVPGARFYIVGSASTYETISAEREAFTAQLRQLAEQPPLAGHVCFSGQRADIEHVIAAMDVVVHCNRGAEGLGRSVLEAMSGGKTVVVSNRWGPAEVVRDGETGVVFEAGDPDALADALLRVASSVELRRRCGTAARRWAESALDPDRLAATFLSTLREVVLP